MVRNQVRKQTRDVSVMVVALGLAISVATSCTLYVDTGRQQCSKDTDCTSRGAELANAICVASLCVQPTRWSCLGSVTWPSAGSGDVTATINLKDIITYQPIVGVAARLCRKLDIACEQPLATDLASDDAGRLVFQAPSGFDGYVELKPKDAIPGVYFFNPPLTSNREIPFVPILPLSELSGFVQLVGRDLVAGRGQVITAAYDCFHQAAEGVAFSSPNADERSTTFYMIKNMPSAAVAATDGSGYGGIINLLPGSLNLSGRLTTGETIGTASVLIRANEVTYTTVLPMPN